MFVNISLKSKRIWCVLVFAITVVILALSIFLMQGAIEKTQNGDAVVQKLDLSFSEYYVQYDMTVISNKNVNTYNVKEWHKTGGITKLEYLDYMKNTVTITLEGNTCNISNSGNTARLVINNMYENKNIASLSTFAYLYNSHNAECCCQKAEYLKDGEIVVSIAFKEGCKCMCSKITEELGLSKLELILKDGIPKNYIIYDKNKKEYISIVYNVYEKNIEI